MKSLMDAAAKLQGLKPYVSKEYEDAINTISEASENLCLDEFKIDKGSIKMTLFDSQMYVELGDTKDGKTVVEYIEVDGKVMELLRM